MIINLSKDLYYSSEEEGSVCLSGLDAHYHMFFLAFGFCAIIRTGQSGQGRERGE